MAKEQEKPDNFSIIRHHVRVVAIVVLVLALLSLYEWYLASRSADIHNSFTPQGEVSTTTIQGSVLEKAAPTVLRIPKLGINTTFEAPLGVNADQSIEVPDSFDEVGWYQYGPTPGELGPAVVLGHVDSYEGPAVFFALGQLTPGDEIYVDRIDGTVATFTVTALERFEQEGFPTELVYGNLDHAGLRLITCSGTYDRETLRYTHNLIVFAKLKE